MFSPKRVGESDHQPGGYVFVRLVSQSVSQSVDEKEGVTLVCSGQSDKYPCGFQSFSARWDIYWSSLIIHNSAIQQLMDSIFYATRNWNGSLVIRVLMEYISFGSLAFSSSSSRLLMSCSSRPEQHVNYSFGRSHPQRDISIPRHHHHHQEHSSSSRLPFITWRTAEEESEF